MLYRYSDEGIWRRGTHELSIWWHHQHCQQDGLDQCSTGIPSDHDCIAAAFLLKWCQDQELRDYLETAREHPTGRLWVDCLIKPTPLALMFLFGERNGDFLLQKHCLKEMLPYFFAAGHQNYARYLSWYV